MPSRNVSKLRRFYLFIIFFTLCKMEKIKYISLERPVVLYNNKKYISFFNVSARRYSRNDPKYYISGHGDFLIPLDNGILVDIIFYKSSGNTYKRTFFELHYRLCDLLKKDNFLGSSIKKGSFKGDCPFPAGAYHVENVTIPIENVPVSLPLKKGRICVNTTYVTGERLGSGYIDIEIIEKQGEFHVENCSNRVEEILAALPFKKGKIYLNLTYTMGESLGRRYFDIGIN